MKTAGNLNLHCWKKKRRKTWKLWVLILNNAESHMCFAVVLMTYDLAFCAGAMAFQCRNYHNETNEQKSNGNGGRGWLANLTTRNTTSWTLFISSSYESTPAVLDCWDVTGSGATFNFGYTVCCMILIVLRISVKYRALAQPQRKFQSYYWL